MLGENKGEETAEDKENRLQIEAEIGRSVLRSRKEVLEAISEFIQELQIMCQARDKDGERKMTDSERDALLIRMDSRLCTLENLVTKIDKTVFGNGEKGLTTRVNILEEKNKSNFQWIQSLGWVVAFLVSVFEIVSSFMNGKS